MDNALKFNDKAIQQLFFQFPYLRLDPVGLLGLHFLSQMRSICLALLLYFPDSASQFLLCQNHLCRRIDRHRFQFLNRTLT